jgi:hypothetical protein
MNNKSKKLINRLYFISDTIYDKKIRKKYALMGAKIAINIWKMIDDIRQKKF